MNKNTLMDLGKKLSDRGDRQECGNRVFRARIGREKGGLLLRKKKLSNFGARLGQARTAPAYFGREEVLPDHCSREGAYLPWEGVMRVSTCSSRPTCPGEIVSLSVSTKKVGLDPGEKMAKEGRALLAKKLGSGARTGIRQKAVLILCHWVAVAGGRIARGQKGGGGGGGVGWGVCGGGGGGRTGAPSTPLPCGPSVERSWGKGRNVCLLCSTGLG